MSVLTQEQIQGIALAALAGAYPDSVAKADIEKLCEEAADARMAWAIWENVIAGDSYVSLKDGKVFFRISERGSRAVEAGLADARTGKAG